LAGFRRERFPIYQTGPLICIENTHNVCGGTIPPIWFMRDLKTLAESRGIPVHMDGARIWNACATMEIAPGAFGLFADSVSVCLSKGLGAPVGSVLVGPAEFIGRARRIRKALGGGMRQSGVLAAAGLKALDDFQSGILDLDHARAQQFAEAIREMPGFRLRDTVETNILFIETDSDAQTVVDLLQKKGVLLSVWGSNLVRLVVHRDIDDIDVMVAIQSMRDVSNII
jgi:threonine aldolase